MNEKTLKLTTWLLNNTNLSEVLLQCGYDSTGTPNNPNGNNAVVERWLAKQLENNESVIDDIVKDN